MWTKKELRRTEAVILSMTPEEREEKCELSIPRRKRIARGSGVSFDDVNRLKKKFEEGKQFCKNAPNLKQLEKMMSEGGSLWR